MVRLQERKQALAETAERERRIKSAETLEWARQFNEAQQRDRERAAEKPMKQDWPTKRDTTMTTDAWANWVRKEIKVSQRKANKTNDAILEAIADVVHEERVKLRKEIEALRERLDKLENENIERGSASLHQLRAITGSGS